MKKYFKYALTFAMALAVTMSFCSCSNDDDNNGGNEEVKTAQFEKITDRYVKDVIYPTYTNLADETSALYEKLVSLKAKLAAGTISDADVNSTCETFLKARAYWEESEAWLYGPADDFGINPHIDTWPLDVNELGNLLTSNNYSKLEGEAGIEYVSNMNGGASQLGFHGVEFILFRNGSNRTAADLKGSETLNNKEVSGDKELTYAIAVAGDLRDKCCQLEVAWRGENVDAKHLERCKIRKFDVDNKLKSEISGLYYGEELLKANGSDRYRTWRGAMQTILTSGCSNIAQEVADQKMGQAYRASTNTSEEGDEYGKDYIESPYSHKSFIDFKGNIESIKNSLYGNIGGSTPDPNSILAYLGEHNPELGNSLKASLDKALASLDVCIGGTAFVTIINTNDAAGLANVKKAMDSIGDFDEQLNEASDWIGKN